MANKNEVKAMVAKILKAYPQLKFTVDVIQGFVDLLSEKLTHYPGWLLDQAADQFITNEIDFPRFNIAGILAYCWRVRGEKMDALKNQLQQFKNDWNGGVTHSKGEWATLVNGFRKLNAVEWANDVEAMTDHYLTPPSKPTTDQIEAGKARLQKLTESMEVK